MHKHTEKTHTHTLKLMYICTHLVIFEVPALDLFVLSSREEVGLSGTDSEGSHRADVACQCELQSTRGQLPQLVCVVCGVCMCVCGSKLPFNKLHIYTPLKSRNK